MYVVKNSAQLLVTYQKPFSATVLLSEIDILPRGIWSAEWLLANLDSIRWNATGLTHVLEHFQLACELTETGFIKLLPLCLVAILKDEQELLGYGHIDTLVALISSRGLFETVGGSVNWCKVYDQDGLEQLRSLLSETVSDQNIQQLINQNIG